MKEWTEEKCSEQPEELQLISADTYMQRKNITEKQVEESEGIPAHTEWVCESREISVSEYNMLQSIKEIKTNEAIDNYTAQLMEEGVI